MTAENLKNTIKRIWNNSSFVEKVKKASLIIQDLNPNPPQYAAFWVDHVIRYGADHLFNHGMEMPWYSYYMIDILSLCLLILAVLIYVFVKFLKLLRIIAYILFGFFVTV